MYNVFTCISELIEQLQLVDIDGKESNYNCVCVFMMHMVYLCRETLPLHVNIYVCVLCSLL